jgi:putative Ca2+/H+ antiporter (TMEM165/GDT1 family)
LVLTSALAVLLGQVADQFIPAKYLKIGAGVLFIIMGVWMVFFPGSD